MSKRITLTALLAVTFLMTTASSVISQQASEMLREEFHQTYPLAAQGRVSLENINGSVKVTTWDRNEVKVDAVKKAYRRDRLDEAKIEIRSDAAGIHIETNYPTKTQTFTDGQGRYDNPAIVEYTLTVPRAARIDAIELINGNLDLDGLSGDVKASSINGRLTARGLTGATKLSTINGKLEAGFDRFDETKPVLLNSINGEVLLIIPSDSNVELRATTVHGQITNDFGLPVRRGRYVGRDLAGQLGQGGARIKLGNVNGQVVIRHAADGRPLSRATSLLTEQEDNKEGDEDEDEAKQQARRAARDAMREAARARAEVHRAQIEARRTQVEAQRAQTEAQRIQRQAAIQAAQRARVDSARIRAQAQAAAARARAQTQVQVQAAREAQRAVQRESARIRAESQRAVREAMRANRGVVVVTDNSLRLVERESKTFHVKGRPNLNLQTFDGYITVRGWDKQEVQLVVSKRAATEQQMRGVRVDTNQNGSSLTVVASFDPNYARREGNVTFNNAAVNLDLYVPRNSTLRLSSGDGRLELEGIDGQVDLTTGDGRIEVRDGRGQLAARTGDGPINVTNFNGQVEARTGDGRIVLDGRFQGLVARTGTGSILLIVPSDFNAVIETDADSVKSEGLTVKEETGQSRRLKRFKIGSGGKVLTLHAGSGGRIILRQAAGQ